MTGRCFQLACPLIFICSLFDSVFEIMGEEYVFTWRIKNYSSCYQVKDKDIASPFFTIENFPGSQWNLSFYPKGDSRLRNDENYVSCFLEWTALYDTIKSVTVSYKIEIVDEKDCVMEVIENKEREFNGQNSSWGRIKFFAIDELDKEMSNWVKDELTLRCRIKSDNQLRQKLSRAAVACTTIEVDRFFVDWHVKIPSLFEYSENIAFPISDLYNVEIALNSKPETLAILVHFKQNKSDISQRLTFTISIFHKIGCMLASKRVVHVHEKTEPWNFLDFMTKNVLKNCEISSSRYEFKLKCEVFVSKKNVSSSSIEKLQFESPFSWESSPRDNPTSSAQNEFRNILASKTYSDVTIRCKNEEFPAHKFVLKVRSPVFAAMFDQDMLENKTGVVDISDIDGKILKAFLELLYTDTVDKMDYDIAKHLILTADKYQVPSLVDKCASFLISIISIENTCEIIAIADMIDCKNLKSFALNFIKVNAAKVLPTAAWAEWIQDNIKLATYILSELSTAIGTNYKLI